METSDLSRLAAKQKRLKSWQQFAQKEIQDSRIMKKTDETLKRFADKLIECWEKNSLSQQDLFAIEDIERELEQLNEEARLRVVGKASNSN